MTKTASAIMCRVEHLDEDLEPVFDEMNSRRLPDAPLLTNGVGWAQRGPIADEVVKGGVKTADTKSSRHAAKFAACGEACLKNVNAYYQKDFETLAYPLHAVNTKCSR
jgi:hypothetical protein